MKDKYDNLDEYISDLKAAIEQSGGQCAAHHYQLGLALLSKRAMVGAENEFRECLRESAHMAEAMVQLGGICMQRGDLEGCLRYNQDAAACRPKFAVAESNIGFCYLQMRDPKKAVAHLDKAVRWDPKFSQARNGLAVAYYMEGKLDQSEKESRELLKDEPAFAPAWNNLALVLFDKGQYAEAREAVQKAQAGGFEVQEGFLKELEEKLA